MTASLTHVLLIALGGGLGSMARAALAARIVPESHPAIAIMVVNVSGSFAIGLAYGLSPGAGLVAVAMPTLFQVFAIGVLGGYTTVSTFAMQALTLWQEGRAWAALANIAGSILGCTAAAAFGILLTRGWG